MDAETPNSRIVVIEPDVCELVIRPRKGRLIAVTVFSRAGKKQAQRHMKLTEEGKICLV